MLKDIYNSVKVEEVNRLLTLAERDENVKVKLWSDELDKTIVVKNNPKGLVVRLGKRTKPRDFVVFSYYGNNNFEVIETNNPDLVIGYAGNEVREWLHN